MSTRKTTGIETSYPAWPESESGLRRIRRCCVRVSFPRSTPSADVGPQLNLTQSNVRTFAHNPIDARVIRFFVCPNDHQRLNNCGRGVSAGLAGFFAGMPLG